MSLLTWHWPRRDRGDWPDLELVEPSDLDMAPYEVGTLAVEDLEDDPFGGDAWWERA